MAAELERFLFPGLYRLELRAQGYLGEAVASIFRASRRVIEGTKFPSRLRDETASAGKLLALIPQARLTVDLGAPFLVFRKVALAERGWRNKSNPL